MKLGFWKLKVRAGKELQGIGPYGMLNQFDQPTQFGSPLSAVRLATHKEGQYDRTDSSWVCIRFYSKGFRFYSTDGPKSRQKMVSQHCAINLMHLFSWTWFVG
jgi:hypothetical protein